MRAHRGWFPSLLRLLLAFALTAACGCSAQQEPSGRSEPSSNSAEQAEQAEEEREAEDSEDPASSAEPIDEAEPESDSPLGEEEEAMPLGTEPGFQLREPTLGGTEESPNSEFRLLEPTLGSHLPGTILVPPPGQEASTESDEEESAE